MLNIAQINLRYEERAIKLNSPPGWELLTAFVKMISERQVPFDGWIFEWNSTTRYYVNVRKFDSGDKTAFIGSFGEFIKKDAICFIRTLKNVPLEILSQNYAIVSEGAIKDNQKSAVFPAPIEIDDWAMIGKDELVIVIHHDGDPLFFLKKDDEMQPTANDSACTD